MWENIKTFFKVLKWTFVYVVLRHHEGLTNFFLFFFGAFFSQPGNSEAVFGPYKTLVICLALLILFFFLWRRTVHPYFTGNIIKEVVCFVLLYIIFAAYYFYLSSPTLEALPPLE